MADLADIQEQAPAPSERDRSDHTSLATVTYHSQRTAHRPVIGKLWMTSLLESSLGHLQSSQKPRYLYGDPIAQRSWQTQVLALESRMAFEFGLVSDWTRMLRSVDQTDMRGRILTNH